MLISITGLIGSGKDTIAEYLVAKHGFKQDSFAGNLKDAISTIFNWDRELLEGKTEVGREWRDQIDTWWAARLGIPHLTPRWVLQYWGTEVCRHGFHDDIWIASLENKLKQSTQNIVISDCRFPNEIKMVQQLTGVTIQVSRGERPEWYDIAAIVNKGPDSDFRWDNYKTMMDTYNIHLSEWAWVGTKFDIIITNNGPKEELYSCIERVLEIGH